MSRKFLIITGANTAREINPYGERPHENCVQNHQLDNYFKEVSAKRWQEAESSLKEYRITEVTNYSEIDELKMNICPLLEMIHRFPVGSKVECEVNEETLEAIIL